MSIDLALLILRLMVGLVIAAHGAQKLFGWFGGGGLKGAIKMSEMLRLRPVRFWALMSGLTEFVGGVLLALGLLNPLGPLGVIAAMLMAIITVHWPRFFNTNRGLEFPLVLLGMSLSAAISGPGAYSLDAWLGLSLPEPLTLIVGLVLVVGGTVLALATRLPKGAAQDSAKA
jgi:putative oxidoreductase